MKKGGLYELYYLQVGEGTWSSLLLLWCCAFEATVDIFSEKVGVIEEMLEDWDGGHLIDSSAG